MKRASVAVTEDATLKRESASQLLTTTLDTSLVCWQCTDLYSDPRQLPCGHSFCLTCLQNACKRYQPKKPTRCPRGCPRDLYLQVRRLEELPVDDALRNKVKDARKKLSAFTEKEITCLIHYKEAEAYCANCNELVCVKCMTSEDHRRHNFEQVNECEEQMKQIAERQMDDADEQRTALERELDDVQAQLVALLQTADELQASIINNKRQGKIVCACDDSIRRFRKLQEILKFNADRSNDTEKLPQPDAVSEAEETVSQL